MSRFPLNQLTEGNDACRAFGLQSSGHIRGERKDAGMSAQAAQQANTLLAQLKTLEDEGKLDAR